MTAALHALILFIFYLLISGLGYPGLVVFQQINIFLIKNKQQETLHQQQAAGEAQQTHSVEITIKPSGGGGRLSLRTGSNPVPYIKCAEISHI